MHPKSCATHGMYFRLFRVRDFSTVGGMPRMRYWLCEFLKPLMEFWNFLQLLMGGWSPWNDVACDSWVALKCVHGHGTQEHVPKLGL